MTKKTDSWLPIIMLDSVRPFLLRSKVETTSSSFERRRKLAIIALSRASVGEVVTAPALQAGVPEFTPRSGCLIIMRERSLV
jgi:hypothetical protein